MQESAPEANDDHTKEQVPQEGPPKLVELAHGQDWFLENIIETVLPYGVETDVTVTVGGTTITGTLISGKKYFRELAESLRSASTGADLGKELGDAVEKFTELYDSPGAKEEDWTPPPVGYIHLSNAQYFSPGNGCWPEGVGILWRGKLTAIDGFAIGRLKVG